MRTRVRNPLPSRQPSIASSLPPPHPLSVAFFAIADTRNSHLTDAATRRPVERRPRLPALPVLFPPSSKDPVFRPRSHRSFVSSGLSFLLSLPPQLCDYGSPFFSPTGRHGSRSSPFPSISLSSMSYPLSELWRTVQKGKPPYEAFNTMSGMLSTVLILGAERPVLRFLRFLLGLVRHTSRANSAAQLAG